MKGTPSARASLLPSVLALACAPSGSGSESSGAESSSDTSDTGTSEGPELATLACDPLPDAAAMASYAYTPTTSAGAQLDDWTATGLPAGLAIDADTGLISGTPTGPAIGEASELYADIELHAFDVDADMEIVASCGQLEVHPPLHALGLRDTELGCLPASLGFDLLAAELEGGDGSELACHAIPIGDDESCPLGQGNGRPPPGLLFDEASCAHVGSIVGERRGTWVWMIEVEQSGRNIVVPVCATNEGLAFHAIELRVDGQPSDELAPALYTFDPDAELSFGAGRYTFDIVSPACPGSACNSFGYRYDITCSPFDPAAPWVITLAPSNSIPEGLHHEMSATGPPVADELRERPFVHSFEMAYCTSANGLDCDASADDFETKAQTKYHFDVIGYPD